MKKQLLAFLLGLGACLAAPMLAMDIEMDIDTEMDIDEHMPQVEAVDMDQDYNCDMDADEDMPELTEVGAVDNTLSWATPTNRIVIHRSEGNPRIATSHLAEALYLAMGHSTGQIKVQNLETGDFLPSSFPRKTKRGEEPPLLQQESGVKYLSFSPTDPHVLAIAGKDRTLKTVDVRTGNVLTVFDTSDTSGAQIAFDCFSPLGWGDDGSGSSYAAGDGISFSADGSFLMSELKQNNTEDYNTPLYGLWNAVTGEFVGKYKDITFFDDGSVLANGSRFNNMKDPDYRNFFKRYRHAISPHSKKMAIVKNNVPHLYSLESGKITFLKKLEVNPNRNTNHLVSFSPDGTRLVVSGYIGGGKNIIEIWDTESGNKIQEVTVPKTFVYGVQLSPDNQKLLCCYQEDWNDYSIEIKDLAFEKQFSKTLQ